RLLYQAGQAVSACPESTLGNLEDCLDLDRHVERQTRRGKSRARMTSRITEHIDHEIGDAVDDGGLLVELGRRVDEAQKLHASLHPVEIAAASLPELRENIGGG